MKPETLNALLVDRELGELPSEVTELLDAYLELAPLARREADAMARTVRTARAAVQRFPELAQGTEVQPPSRIVPLAPWLAPWLARAAALVAVAGLGAWLGYRTGVSSIPADSARLADVSNARTVASSQAGAEFKNLWARYDVAYDYRRGVFTIAKQP